MNKTLPLLALVLTVALVACDGDAGPTDTTTDSSTTTTAPTTTTTEAPTTTTVPGHADPVTVYVLDPSGGNDARPGPFLYPIATDPVGGETEAEAALVALFRLDGFDSAIPAGATVEALSMTGATAEVDLSDEFASGGGSASMFARLAQLTYTVTAVDGIESVLLVEEGRPVEVFSAEGIVLDGPMVREDFEDLLPGILLDVPAAGAEVELPLTISGVAAAFEGVFQLQVLEGNTVVFEPDFVSTGTGIGWGPFEVVADIEAAPGTPLTIRVWEFSAEDGSVVSERFVPVIVAG